MTLGYLYMLGEYMLKSSLLFSVHSLRGKCAVYPFCVLAFTSEPRKKVLLLGLLLLFMRVFPSNGAFGARCRPAITHSLGSLPNYEIIVYYISMRACVSVSVCPLEFIMRMGGSCTKQLKQRATTVNCDCLQAVQSYSL